MRAVTCSPVLLRALRWQSIASAAGVPRSVSITLEARGAGRPSPMPYMGTVLLRCPRHRVERVQGKAKGEEQCSHGAPLVVVLWDFRVGFEVLADEILAWPPDSLWDGQRELAAPRRRCLFSERGVCSRIAPCLHPGRQARRSDQCCVLAVCE